MADDGSIHDSSLSLPLLEHIDSICTDFESAWQAATPPLIDEYLEQAQGAERSELLHELLRLELDYRSRRLHDVSLAVLQRDYPDQAELIADVFRGYGEYGYALATSADNRSHEADATTIPACQAATLIGDADSELSSNRFAGLSLTGAPRYRIKRSHARGGLGEVFVAHDQELHRDVAVKEIQKEHAQSPSAKSRFSLEAEVTGRLEHPGVVPVYSLGTLPDGRPFYAMRFVHGRSLRQAVGEFRQDAAKRSASEQTIEFHKLLGRFVDVCQTMEYAHSRGVLHRDLKPSNIMLGEYGETLIVDWGLAKAYGDVDTAPTLAEPTQTERENQKGPAQTVTGAALGTPAYMSPEQAAGRRDQMGPRSDIYSLGATLYTLLTGKSPFESDEISQVLRKVRSGEFDAPRTIDSRVPRALEAVCLKAMALNPEDRYASAQALAEDIEAWLADRRVSAYREPVTARLGRWIRQHRGSVTAATAAAAVAMIGLAVGVAMLSAKNSELRTANQREANASRLAQQRFDLALEAIESFYTGASEDVVLKQPEMTDFRKRLLQTPLVFYERLCNSLEDESNPSTLAALADAYHAIGTLRLTTGSPREGTDAFQREIDVRQSLPDEDDQTLEMQIGLAESYLSMGQACRLSGEVEKGLALVSEAIDMLEDILLVHPRDPNLRRALVASYGRAGGIYSKLGDREMAISYRQEAVQLAEQLTSEYPDVVPHLYSLGLHRKKLALELQFAGQKTEALNHYESAVRMFESLAMGYPDNLEAEWNYAWQLQCTYHSLGVLQCEIGAVDEARDSLEKAIQGYERFLEACPNVADYQRNFGLAHLDLSKLQSRAGELEEAVASAQTAARTADALAELCPGVEGHRHQLAAVYNHLGTVRRKLGQLQDAREDFEEAQQIIIPLVAESPDIPAYLSSLARLHNNRAHLLSDLGQQDEALQHLNKAIAISRELVSNVPAVPQYRCDLARHLSNRGITLRSLKRLSDSNDSYRDSAQIYEVLVAECPEVVAYREELANVYNCLGKLHLAMSQHEAAVEAYRQVIRHRQQIARYLPHRPERQESVAGMHSRLGGLLRDQREFEEACASYDQAIDIRKKLVADHPSRSEYAVYLGGTCCNRGGVARDMDDPDNALVWYGEAIDNLQSVLARDSANSMAKEFLYKAHWGRAQTFHALGSHPQAVADLERAVVHDPHPLLRMDLARARALAKDHVAATQEAMALAKTDGPGTLLYRIACVFALSVAAADSDENLPLQERNELADHYGERATQLLREARETGCFNDEASIQRFHTDSDLDPIRSREDFQLFLNEVKREADNACADTPIPMDVATRKNKRTDSISAAPPRPSLRYSSTKPQSGAS